MFLLTNEFASDGISADKFEQPAEPTNEFALHAAATAGVRWTECLCATLPKLFNCLSLAVLGVTVTQTHQ